MQTPWYKEAYRRILVDMHIPDWDEKFLSRYDVDAMVDCYERARVNSVMLYCQSHLGLCYWPTTTGIMHRGLKGRDVVGEMVKRLKEREIKCCAYYSLIHNNQAFLDHPDWRMIPADEPPANAFRHSRYGTCCPNNAGYREFALAQAEELIRAYDFDGIFFDMTMWVHVCICPDCRKRFYQETGKEIPATIDWADPDWCAFQAARERWVSQFGEMMTQRVKAIKAGMPVYHNFATGPLNWKWGLPLSSSVINDFLGGDFYGGPMEQLAVIKLMNNLSQNRPVEFMTSLCGNLNDHILLKQTTELEIQAFAATLFSSAFLFIDAIDPIGTADPRKFDLIGNIFKKTAPYEPFLGGDPVEDIAVYFSNESKFDPAENGKPVGEGKIQLDYPYQKSIQNICRILQQAHLPFGVITRKQLHELGRYKAVILADAIRMDEEEVEAIRNYVCGGGGLYASGTSSLYESKGLRHGDFMLADVFGCHFEADDLGRVTYLKPGDAAQREAIAPHPYLAPPPHGTLGLAERVEGKVLATLTLPYGSPHEGSLFDTHWASIHSSPPWGDTARPVVVENQYGRGRSIYCAAKIEMIAHPSSDGLFLHYLRQLLEEPLSYHAQAHPAVWINASCQAETGDTLIGFLNYQTQLPLLPAGPVEFTLHPGAGRKFTNLLHLPDQTPVEFQLDEQGGMKIRLEDLQIFEMFLAKTEACS